MRRTPCRITPVAHHPHPAGATLTEVLMALLVMSVGVVAVITLFPLSLVSSIRASQLTTAKIFKDNIEEMVHIVPEVLSPPFDNGIWHDGLNLAGAGTYWQPLTQYNEGDVILPTLKKGKVFPVPYFALACTVNGMSGPTEPDWNHSTLQYDDNEIGWQVIRIPNFVIDPLGAQFSTAAEPQVFGNRDGVNSPISQNDLKRILPRRSPIPGLSGEAAQRFCSSPDSWTVINESVPITISGTLVTFPQSFDVGAISYNPANSNQFPSVRIVFTTPDQLHSIVRYPTYLSSANQVALSDTVASAYTGPARLEVFEPRYSFLLTVSNMLANPEANVVNFKEMFSPPKLSIAVFFNRQYSADIEYAYLANFGNNQFTAESSVQNSSLQTDQVQISWTQGTDPDPFLKVGSYVLDARNLIYYRIINASKGAGTATITVDQPIEARARTQDNKGVGLAILMPGIVHVYNATDIE